MQITIYVDYFNTLSEIHKITEWAFLFSQKQRHFSDLTLGGKSFLKAKQCFRLD